MDRALGVVLAPSTGFRFPSGNVRCPDTTFVSVGRLGGRPLTDDFCDFLPDIAVEVLSPSDLPRLVLDRIGEYLQAGVPLVWVIDPEAERAAVHRSLTDVRQVDLDGTLDGGDVLPGFAVRLRELLA